MNFLNTAFAISAATAMTVLMSAGAQACSSGFLADMACKAGIIDKKTANAADAFHAGIGRPLDHAANQAAGAGANMIVPGSGAYVTQGLELRDQYNRSGFNRGPQGGFNGGPRGGYMPVAQPALGNFCNTPAGRFGPGPLQPVGQPCMTYGPLGNVPGVVSF